MKKIAVPGDFQAFLAFLDSDKNRKVWLSEAGKVLAENEKAVRLLKAPDTIEANLKKSETAKSNAEKLLESAKAQAESIVQSAEEAFSGREEAVLKSEKALEDRINKENTRLREKEDDLDEKLANSSNETSASWDALKIRTDAVTKRENAIAAREKRADTKMDDAREMKAVADETVKNIMAAMPKVAS